MARLSAARRRALPRSAFAIPQRRAYPIEDKGHAEAAEGEAAAHGTPAERAQVDRAVARRYPAFRRHRLGR